MCVSCFYAVTSQLQQPFLTGGSQSSVRRLPSFILHTVLYCIQFSWAHPFFSDKFFFRSGVASRLSTDSRSEMREDTTNLHAEYVSNFCT